MATAPLDRQRAVARTRLAQAGVVACIALGGAIAAFGLPGVRPPAETEPLKVTELAPGPTTSEAVKPSMNLSPIADRLALVSNHPVVPKVEEVKTDGKTEAPPPPPPAPVEDVKFLGLVHLGTARMALVAKADKQMFVSVGSKVGEDTVTEISETEIKVGTRTIKLSPKAATLITHAGSSSGGTGAPGMPGMPGMPGGKNTGAMNFQNQAAANAALAARAAASKAGGIRPQPMPQGNYSAVPAAPFPDPARNGRYQQLIEKYRNAGEYKTELEVAEAAMKQTDQEAISGQIPGYQQTKK
ncbi:MAG: hypothetical protein JSR77_12975 [Planctomycetes bacterium]|nr:hypothetical protein [Planctomycetota bacterium]